MFDFQPSEQFEPTSNTKEWCLYTHKTEYSFAGVKLPGLFQTTYYEWHILGFISIFILEGIATFWCYREGVLITAILASIFFDIVLAIVAHIFQKDICRMRNELVFENDNRVLSIKRNLNKVILKQQVFYVLILVSAGFKIFWFLSVYGIIDATTLFIMTCYTLGAVLHISCTGYAVFTFIFNRKINKEHNEYIDTVGKSFAFDPNKPLPYQFEFNDIETAEIGHHKIVKKEDNKFYLYSLGVLTDIELRYLIGQQLKPEQKRSVAIEGVRHQMSILKTSTERRKEVESNISFISTKSVSMLFLFVISIFFFIGCSTKDTKDFNLKFIISDKLGEKKTDGLPQEIIDLSMPMDNCSKYILIPKPTLHRIGLDQSNDKSLETRIEGGFAGNKSNPNYLKRIIEKHLKSEQIGEIFSGPNNPDINLRLALDNDLSTLGKHTFPIIFSSNGEQEDYYEDIKIYSDIDSVRQVIANELCENNPSLVIVYLNPSFNQSNSNNSSPLGSEIESKNEIIEQQTSLSDRKRSVTQTVTYYKPKIEEDPDPFALYALSKTVIYGQEHHEAFELLGQAAILAIKQGKATELYKKIANDIELDLSKDIRDRTIWRLSVGHEDHWLPIIEALTKNNAQSLYHN